MNKIDEYKDKMNWDIWEDVSPCVGICTLNEDSICIGCDRHIDEIMNNYRAPEESCTNNSQCTNNVQSLKRLKKT